MLHRLLKAQRGVLSICLLIAVALISIWIVQATGAGLAAVQPNLDSEPLLETQAPSSPTQEPPTSTPTSTATPIPTVDSVDHAVAQDLGTLLYVSRFDGYEHIVAFSVGDQQSRQLSSGPWHDRDPAVSPDGTRIAFASHRDGNWELYLLDIVQGSLRRLTNTEGLEGRPTWSPDGMWIAYEACYESNFDIWILPVDGSQPPIQLTSDLANDHSPSWDPVNRRIAFASDRDGEMDVYIARLDRADDRFLNLTSDSSQPDFDPAFSPDGVTLAYVTRREGMDFIIAKNADNFMLPGRILGQGQDPTWTSDGSALLAILRASHENYLMTYPFSGGGSTVAGLPQPTRLMGLGWSQRDLIAELSAAGIDMQSVPENAGTPANGSTVTDGSVPLVSLIGIEAPIPKLSQRIIDPFNQLRDRVVLETGWDFLGVLDNAFVGVNDPMPPGYSHVDWLYTGRAFSINSSTVHARWVEIVREDHGGMTYWRVFIRASRQDGSLGQPLRSLPWDIEARFSSDPSDYDGGGRSRAEVPTGYYIDFTELAADYGFVRQAALVNWRTFFPGARFGEFAHVDGLTWHEAMLQIYPPTAFVTPTPYRTPIPGG